jgi:hypothetical protein
VEQKTVMQHLHLIHICMQEVELFFFLCDQHEVYTVADIFIVLQVFFRDVHVFH